MTTVTANFISRLPAWVSANREAIGRAGEDIAEGQAERDAIQREGEPGESSSEGKGGPNPWDDSGQASPAGDDPLDVPWEQLDEPVDCPVCGSFDCWWDLLDGRHCMKCHPPNKARLLRSTVATQRRRAERRRIAAKLDKLECEMTPL